MSTPEIDFAAQAQDPDYTVRMRVASHPEAPKSVLLLLAQDEYAQVRAGVAGNPITPPDPKNLR